MGHRFLRGWLMHVGLCVALLAIAILHSIGTPAETAEAATGVYILGSRTVGAGITPPAGNYFQDDTYIYSGKAVLLWIDTSSQVAAAKPIKTKILTTWRLRHAPADLCE
jgi:hypothetical protein